jgi:hydrogenase maturation protease
MNRDDLCMNVSEDSKIMVAGIGNVLMSDDGFGPKVIELLQNKPLSELVEVRDMGTAGLTIATELEGFDIVIFVDSMDINGEPGNLQQVEIDLETIEASEAAELSKLTVHEVGLEGLLKFSKAIGTLPSRVFIVGCRPEKLGFGFGLSPSVERAAEEASEKVLRLLDALEKNVVF